MSIQISILRQYKLPWLNIRRRRWRSPCLPNGGPHTCSHPLKHAHHQVGRAKALKLDFLVKNYGHLHFVLWHLDSSSGSEDETAVRRQSSVVAPQPQVNPNLQSPESWVNHIVQGSSTSSSASSTLSQEAKPQPQSQPQPQYKPQYQPLYKPHHQPQYQPQHQPHEQPRTAAVTDMLAHSRIGETCACVENVLCRRCVC